MRIARLTLNYGSDGQSERFTFKGKVFSIYRPRSESPIARGRFKAYVAIRRVTDNNRARLIGGRLPKTCTRIRMQSEHRHNFNLERVGNVRAQPGCRRYLKFKAQGMIILPLMPTNRTSNCPYPSSTFGGKPSVVHIPFFTFPSFMGFQLHRNRSKKSRRSRPARPLQKLPSTQSSRASLKTHTRVLGIEKWAIVTWDEIILVIHNFIIS